MKKDLFSAQSILQAFLYLGVFAVSVLPFWLYLDLPLPYQGEAFVPAERIDPIYARTARQIDSLLSLRITDTSKISIRLKIETIDSTYVVPTAAQIDSLFSVPDSTKANILLKIKKQESLASGEHLLLWVRLALLFYTTFATLAFFAVAAYANRRYQDNNPEDAKDEIRRTTGAYRWFAGAMSLWALSNALKLFDAYFSFHPELFKVVVSIISSLNSMCIMLALTYLGIRIDPKANRPVEKMWRRIKEDPACWRAGIAWVSAAVIVLDIGALWVFGEQEDNRLEFIFDAFLLSPLTSILLGSGLYLVFQYRKIAELSHLAIFTMLVTFFYQIINVIKIDPSSDPLVFVAVKALFSFLYTSFLVILLFSLVLSWLGWQKSELLEDRNEALKAEQAVSAEKTVALEEAVGNLRAREEELQNLNELNQAFISIISDAMNETYMERLFDVSAERLRANKIFDYFFGLAIQKANSSWIHFPYYKYDTDLPKRNYATLPEGTYVGLCLERNEIIFEPDLQHPTLLPKLSPGRRSQEIAPKSCALIYLPLVRTSDGKPFGALTIQWRRAHPVLTEKQRGILENIATLFARVIDPEKILLRPEIAFIRNAAEGLDAQYHFEYEQGDTGKPPVRPNGYTLLDTLMKWYKDDTDVFLGLKSGNLYLEQSGVNRLMKGLSTGICSCGAVMLAFTAAVERMRPEHGEAGNPQVLGLWQQLFAQSEARPDAQLNRFFRGRPEHKGYLEERFGVIYALFQVLFYVENQEDKRKSNLRHTRFDLERSEVSFEFGINDVAGLRRKIEDNGAFFLNGGEKALQHNLSSKILLLGVHFSGGGFQYELLNDSIKLTFAL